MKSFKKLLGVVVALVLCIAMTIPTMAAPAEGFTDVEDGAWYETAVERWADAGLIEGPGDGTFGTNDDITRAEVAAIMQRLLGLNAAEKSELQFTDVTRDDWFYDEVMSCAAAGILNGYGNGTFGPNDSITREQAFTMVMRSLLTEEQLAAADTSVLDRFVDKGDISEYAIQHVAAIVECEAVNGYEDGTVRPLENITRAEFATILNRLIAVYVYTNPATNEIEVSTFVPRHATEVDLAGAGFIVVHSSQDDIEVTYEVKTVDEETVKAVVIVKNVEGDEIRKEVTITTESDDIVIVHGQVDSATKGEIKDGETLVVDKHETVTVIDNCAAGGKVVDKCEVCGDSVVETIAPKTHTFNDDGVCTVCGMDTAEAMKFHARVESNGEYVDAFVTNDYVAKLEVTSGQVDASEVKLSVEMQDVASLGGGTKSHSQTINTGMEGAPYLSDWLENVFNFTTGTINADIQGKEVTYKLQGMTDNETGTAIIEATPSTVDAARTAWAELTDHVETLSEQADDSYINIANGSYMIVDNDKLCFEKGTEDDLKLDNFSDLGALEDEIRSKVQLITNDAFKSTDYVAKFYLAAGTELSVSSSRAILEDNCTITFSGTGLNTEDFTGVLSRIQAAESGKAMATELVNMIDAMVGSADGKAINVDITFDAPVEKATKFYLGMTANNADGNDTTTVDMEVFDDYSLEINLPMNEISAAEVTLDVSMTNVGSLGVNGTKSHSQEISTGLNYTGDLASYLDNAPDFTDATINATIVDVDGTKYPCTYELTSDMDADWITISGTTDTDAARAAWKTLTSVVTTSDNDGDSYFFIAGNSFIDTTHERLAMVAQGAGADWNGLHGLALDNFSNLEALKANIKAAVEIQEAREDAITLFMGTGSILAVSNSKAILGADVKVTIEGIDVSETLLSDIRTAANTSDKELVQKLFGILNEAIGAMNGKSIDVTVELREGGMVG